MTSPAINVQVHQEFQSLVSAEWVQSIVIEALAQGPSSMPRALGVVIADDEVVRGLNGRYRGLDENTDVLAFSFDHQGEYYGDVEHRLADASGSEFVLPPGDESGLGEVIISFPQARRQAAQSQHSVEVELATLLAHGVLHLLGHDHQQAQEETAMKRAEAQVLDKVLRQSG